MPSPPILDLALLLAPLANGSGITGANMRDVANNAAGRALYDSIRGSRNLARLKEKPQMLGDPSAPPGPPEEWRVVLDKSLAALSAHSKDLEITTYLIEAVVRLHGFSGLRDAFHLYRSLVEKFWETLYPPADEDGVGGRVAGLTGLNGDTSRDGALLFPLGRVPLSAGNGASFGLFHYEVAIAMDKLPPDRQEERVKAGQANIAMFQSSLKMTPPAFHRNLLQDIRQCIDEYDKLDAELGNKCGPDAPPSSKIREALSKCRQIVESAVGPETDTADEKSGVGIMTNAPAGDTANSVAAYSAPRTFRNRDEAFETLLRVSQYFREAEPQSPVIFALEQVVRWGKMPLPELLTELISDDSARTRLFQMVGIRPPSNS